MTTSIQSQQPVVANPRTYYVFDYSKLSLLEIWQQRSLNPFRLIALANILAAKSIRHSRRGGVPSLFENIKRIELGEIPEQIRRDIDPLIRSLQSAGYSARLAQTTTKAKGDYAYGVHFLSSDRLSTAAVIFARVKTSKTAPPEIGVGIWTYRLNGQTFSTSNRPLRIKAPPELRVEHRVGATVEQLVARHRNRVLSWTDAIVVSDTDFDDRVSAMAQRNREYQIGRGFFAPATSQEMVRYRDRIIAPGYFETPE